VGGTQGQQNLGNRRASFWEDPVPLSKAEWAPWPLPQRTLCWSRVSA
jgi:hypothetical protein